MTYQNIAPGQGANGLFLQVPQGYPAGNDFLPQFKQRQML